MLKFFQGSKILPSVVAQVVKSNVLAAQNIHTMASKDEQTKEEQEKEKMRNVVKDDINHFDDKEGLYVNPKFAKEVEERFRIKSDVPDTTIKTASAEQIDKSKQTSQTK